MPEIDLLKNYPKTKRNLKEASIERTDEVRKVARLFGKDLLGLKYSKNQRTYWIIRKKDLGKMDKQF